MFVTKAAVVGGGTMGGEIAQVIANADIPVVVKDIEQKFVDAALEKAREVTKSQLDRLVSKEKIDQKAADARLDEVMGLITGATDYEGFGDVDFVIEAVPEKMEIKKAVYAELDEATPGHAILASNTSSLSITEMGRETLRPNQVAGFHFFYPASVLPLVEVIYGEDTSRETVTTAFNFAQAIRKQPITCREVPGFVVNRVLNAGAGEIWRAQEEQGLSIKKIDEAAAGKTAPMGPFVLVDALGLDTTLHVAEYLQDVYGDRFYVHKGMQKLVKDGKLGAKSGGEGFYKEGQPNVKGDADPPEELTDLVLLHSLVEACRLLEEGVCTVREIDLGMMAGAGMDPRRGLFPPFWKADMEGLDTVLEKLEAFEESHGERFAPPRILKRLVSQGRVGLKSGHGFYAYPQGEGEGSVKLEKRDDVAIAWLANPPMNAISPDVIGDLRKVWDQVKADDELKAMVVYSSLPVVYSAGADIKAFTQMDTPEKGAQLINDGHALLKELGESQKSTVAAVNAIAFGGGCELAMACDFRVAAESAVFGQPEINLGIIPGFGGTQRLPRLIGEVRAKQMNLTGDAVLAKEARQWGLADDLVPDEQLLDVAISWARKLGGQAPLAVEAIKQVSNKGELEEGIEAEKEGFAKVFLSEDGREGISAFLQKRKANWKGK